MEPTRIVIARHLPTRKNTGKERLRGWGSDHIEQEAAERIAPQMAKIFDAQGVTCIYCSTLQRGLDTAHAIARNMENEPEITPREQMLTFDTGKYTGKLRDDVWGKIEHFIENPEIPVPGDERYNGEAFGDDGFVGRWSKEIRYQIVDAVEEESKGGRNGWVLHGHEFWTMMPIIEGRNPELDDHVSPAPGSVFLLELWPDKSKLVLLFNSEAPHSGGMVS